MKNMVMFRLENKMLQETRCQPFWTYTHHQEDLAKLSTAGGGEKTRDNSHFKFQPRYKENIFPPLRHSGSGAGCPKRLCSL